MKKIQEQLAWISKTLAGLAKQVNTIARKVKTQAPAKQRGAAPGRRPGQKPPASPALKRSDTVLESVFSAISRSRNGLSIGQLLQKTELEPRQLSNALYKLGKKGLVHTRARGVYVKS